MDKISVTDKIIAEQGKSIRNLSIGMFAQSVALVVWIIIAVNGGI